MKKQADIFEKDGYILRMANAEDAERYYEGNFNPLDAEVARLTGSRTDFSHDEVVNFFRACAESEEYYHFLIIAPDERIIGESVINQIDWAVRSANFRICVFHREDCGRGAASWAIGHTVDFAFETLGLHRLELDVFSFNKRAQRAYEKAGFVQEGILRDAIWTEDGYADDILMAILEDEWRARNRDGSEMENAPKA